MPDKKVELKFKCGMSPYQAGETASFDRVHAKKIVKAGYAQYVNAPAEPESGSPRPDGLEQRTVSELRSMAREAGIKRPNNLKKPELVELLRKGVQDAQDEQ